MSAAPDEENLVLSIRREIAEAGKLQAEERELFAEERKLMREGDRRRVDLWLAPVIALGGIAIGILGLLVALSNH